MKRVWSIVLSALLVLSLTACGGGGENGGNSSGEQPQTNGESGGEPAAAGDFKVAMITDVGGINDQSYNSMSWAGLELARDELGIEVKYFESSTEADYEPNLNTAIDEGYGLIICIGWLMADTLEEVAAQNPDTMFAIVDSEVDLPNVTGIKFASEECSYLVGVIAAEMTETDNVGILLGMVSPEMNLFSYGFYAGVLDTNPDITIQAYNANSFTDVAAGKAATLNMFSNGADIVYQVAGATGLGVIEAAKEEGRYAIGVEVDQSYLAPEAVITSAMRLIDNAILQVCTEAMNGTLEGGVHKYDLASNCVDAAPTMDLLSDEAIAALNEAREKIISGEIVVPDTMEAFEAQYGAGIYTLEG